MRPRRVRCRSRNCGTRRRGSGSRLASASRATSKIQRLPFARWMSWFTPAPSPNRSAWRSPRAWRAGARVVMSLGGGAAEIVTPGVDALACPPGDAGALARSIERLAADAALRQRLGQAARLTAERGFTRRRLVERNPRRVRQRGAGRSRPGAPRAARAQREPLRRRGDVPHDVGARQRGGAGNDVVVRPLLRGPVERRTASARSRPPRARRRAIEPSAHGVAGPSSAFQASRSSDDSMSSSATRRGRMRSSARRFGARACRSCSGCTPPATAATGSSGGRGV